MAHNIQIFIKPKPIPMQTAVLPTSTQNPKTKMDKKRRRIARQLGERERQELETTEKIFQ